jgi:hypothetical protein
VQIKYIFALHLSTHPRLLHQKCLVNIYDNKRNVKESKAAEQPAKREKKSIAVWKKVVYCAELTILPAGIQLI